MTFTSTHCVDAWKSFGSWRKKILQTKEATGNNAKPSASPFGVHSEVGKLRKVMVCRPGLAHLRLTPDNCKDLLFDDVIWVQEAKNEHYKFVEVMRDRGIDVVDMHDLLATTLEDPEARKWVLDRKINPDRVALFVAGRSARVAQRDAVGRTGRVPDRRHRHQRCAACAFDAAAASISTRWASSCRRCPTRSSRATPPAGSTAA